MGFVEVLSVVVSAPVASTGVNSSMIGRFVSSAVVDVSAYSWVTWLGTRSVFCVVRAGASFVITPATDENVPVPGKMPGTSALLPLVPPMMRTYCPTKNVID